MTGLSFSRGTHQGLHAPDAPAARQVLKRFEGIDHFGVGADFGQAFLDLVHGPAGLVGQGCRHHLEAFAARKRHRVPEADLGLFLDQFAAHLGRVDRAAQPR